MTLSDKAGKFSILPPDSVIYTLLTTGLQNCHLPKDIARAVHAAAGVLRDDSTGNVPFVPCNLSTADTTFTFGFGGNKGPAVKVPIKELVYPQEDNITFADGSPACEFAIDANDDQMAILGDPFLRSAYAVFDLENNQIALAQSRNSKDPVERLQGSNIKPIANGTAGIPGVASRLSSIPYPQSYIDEYSAYASSASVITASGTSMEDKPPTTTPTPTPGVTYPAQNSRLAQLPPKALFTALSAYKRS
ncbi:MAG: hypothetical protein Q9208_003748 [Pyrenodesmia sp. 3 TL-2023]